MRENFWQESARQKDLPENMNSKRRTGHNGRKILYSMESPFQQEINVKGYYFGKMKGKNALPALWEL